MEKLLTWKEFYALALKNYAHGGDGVVECWDENTYELMGKMTKAQALQMFHDDEQIEKDQMGW